MKKSIISIAIVLIFSLLTLVAYADGNTSNLTQIANMKFRVLINDEKEHIIDYKTSLKLAEGYELHVTSVDNDGAHLLLTKEWDKVDKKVISPWKEGATIADSTYYYNKSNGNITNMTIVKVHLKSAVISKEDYSVTVDKIWQISEEPVLSPAEIASIEKKEKEEREQLEKKQKDEREKPKKHQYSIGTSCVNEFILNWTDKKNYSDITSRTLDYTWIVLEALTTSYDVFAINETGPNTTLHFTIVWHPSTKRPAEATLTNFPSKLHTEAITSQSDTTIQGKSGMIFAYREQRDYQGSNAPPSITPPFYEAKYFLDDYTEIYIFGDLAYWSAQDFNAMLSTLKITPPTGYY